MIETWGFLLLMGFAFILVVIVEFFAIGFRVGSISARLKRIEKMTEDQTRYLAILAGSAHPAEPHPDISAAAPPHLKKS